ncbi:MAG: phage holin family protein [Anaerolineae bacterium]|nr:phage holin family protein [Anaerolineae bacterium]
MRNFLLRVIINAIAIAVAATLIDGINVTNDIFPLLMVGAILTVVNVLIKPILLLLSCPAVILTLGLFIFVVNGMLLRVAAYFAGDAFSIEGLWPAVLGGIVMAIVNMVLEGLLGDKKSQQAGKKKHN